MPKKRPAVRKPGDYKCAACGKLTQKRLGRMPCCSVPCREYLLFREEVRKFGHWPELSSTEKEAINDNKVTPAIDRKIKARIAAMKLMVIDREDKQYAARDRNYGAA